LSEALRVDGQSPGHAALVDLFESLALAAGRAIMEVYRSDFTFEEKADASPVTLADQRAEAIILEGLRGALPDTACVAEEEVAAGRCPTVGSQDFILIDPLDGTREFLNRKNDFTVNIALVSEGVPVAGVVYAPARGRLYSGRPGEARETEVDEGHRPVSTRPIAVSAPKVPPRIVASRSHRTPETDAFIARFEGAETVSVGSSLKFCLLASGEADLYPRFGRTMEWDTAAGDAVLRAAGGRTLTLDGAPLTYGKTGQPGDADFANPHFIADTGFTRR
jgi:3'(2'), 5'-bisphosphate nucleotidase